MKFLAVDDEPLILEILKATLAPLENSTFSSESDAQTALGRLDEDFDCFLLDVHMPEVNGIELVKAIRSTKRHADTPILMITAASDHDIIEQVYAEGATDYISKPIDRREVMYRVGCIQRLLTERAQYTRTLAENDKSSGQAFEKKYFFSTVPRMREYTSFENYVQTLSQKSLLSFAFLGVHVSNAANLHVDLDTATYDQVLEDIANSLSEAISDEKAVFAHAGGGNFIVALNRFATIDMAALLQKTREAMKEHETHYSRDGIDLPRLRKASHVKPTFFSIARQHDLLDRMLTQAQHPKRDSLPPIDQTIDRLSAI